MEQTDLDLLQMVPPYHLQAVVKARRVPFSAKSSANGSSANTSGPSTSFPLNSVEVAHHIFDVSSIQRTVGELSESEMLVLRELVACGGRANSRDLALYFTSAGLLSGKKEDDHLSNDAENTLREASRPQGQGLQYPTAHPHGVFEQAIRHLLILGLLFWGKQTSFAGRDYSSGIHDGVLIVPITVREVVRQEWDFHPRLKLPDDYNINSVGEGIRTLQRSLYLYWSLVAAAREGLPLVNNGLLSRSALRNVIEHMESRTRSEQIRTESESPRLLFLRLLLMKLGLLQERKGNLYAAPAEQFFALSLLERTRRCYQLYKQTPFWNELLYLPEVQVRPGPAVLEPAHEEVIRSRQIVLDRLQHESVNYRQEIGTVIARTKLYAPYLLFPRQYGSRAERYSSSSNPYGWDFRLRRGWLTHREGWHLVEGGFIRMIITGPLHWLGLVELNREEQPEAFQFLPDAAAVIGDIVLQDEVVPWGRLIAQPNFELIVLAPVSEALLVKLDRFAERVSLELVAQYRITRASVTRAIQTGMHADDILQVIESAAGGEVPQNVRYSVGEWERQARRVEIWQGAILLEVDDTTLLDSLFATPATRQFLGRRLAPHIAEVLSQHMKAVQEILWQRDYLPAQSVAPVDVVNENSTILREAQWHLLPDGSLQPCYAVVDLYLAAEVERFCERDTRSGWYRITALSLQKALDKGLTLEYILHFLQQYCVEGIPGSLLLRLKLWGNGYGEQSSVHVEQSPLLRLSDEVLADLQTDKELKDLLGTQVEQQSRLVRVKAENLQRVIDLLQERGFTVREN